jgi:hypothetical protein
MVTFKPVGRMGNFLFEAASAMAYALSHKQEFTIPNATNDEYWNPIYLLHLANPRYNPDLPEVVVTEKEFPFHKRPFDPAWEKYYPGGYNIRLDGYYQTEKYFRGFRAHILKTFNFPWIMVPGVVSVHVRRGDYLTIKKVVAGREMLKHPPVPKQWIEEQMAKFPNYKFAFFSDDIAWCQKEFGARADCVFNWTAQDIPATRIEQDLIAMSWCEHHICSASTFSWWGAWLNRSPKKRVIMPTHWITPGWAALDCRDVVPPEWERA